MPKTTQMRPFGTGDGLPISGKARRGRGAFKASNGESGPPCLRPVIRGLQLEKRRKARPLSRRARPVVRRADTRPRATLCLLSARPIDAALEPPAHRRTACPARPAANAPRRLIEIRRASRPTTARSRPEARARPPHFAGPRGAAQCGVLERLIIAGRRARPIVARSDGSHDFPGATACMRRSKVQRTLGVGSPKSNVGNGLRTRALTCRWPPVSICAGRGIALALE